MKRVKKTTPAPAKGAPEQDARATFEWFDALWERLTPALRAAYLWAVAPPEERRGPAPATPELVALAGHGLLTGGDPTATVPPRAAEFALRLASLRSLELLDDPDPGLLLATWIEVLVGPEKARELLELLKVRVKRGADPCDLLVEQVLDPSWLELAPDDPGARRLLGLLRAGSGVMLQADARRVIGPGTDRAIETLLRLLQAFEGLERGTHRLTIGLLSPLRRDPAPARLELDDRDAEEPPDTLSGGSEPAAAKPSAAKPASAKAKRAASAPAPVVVAPAVVPPAAAAATPATPAVVPLAPAPRPARPPALDDLETLLVFCAGERLRLAQDGWPYVDDAAKLEAQLAPAHDKAPNPATRSRRAITAARALNLAEGRREQGGVQALRPTKQALEWLALPASRRWGVLVEATGDEHAWLGGKLEALAHSMSYWALGDEGNALLIAPLAAVAPGRRPLDELLAPWRGASNPLFEIYRRRFRQGAPLEEVAQGLRNHLRWSAPDLVAERSDALAALDLAYRRGVLHLLRHLEHLGGAVVAGPDEAAAVELLPAGRAYLGLQAWPADALPDDPPARVVVQPNLELLVIGHAPAVLCSLARFCALKPGAGPARTLVLERDRVVDAVARGISGAELEAALEAAAPGAVPQNVLRSVRDWAASVRRVRLVHVPVLLCDDEETALVVRSLAGKETVLDGHPVPVERRKLAAFRKLLQRRGLVVDDADPGA